MYISFTGTSKLEDVAVKYLITKVGQGQNLMPLAAFHMNRDKQGSLPIILRG